MSDQTAPALPAPTVAPPTNTMAILALVLSFVVSVAGIVCGHLALAQIRRTGEAGRELALAGLIVGYTFTGIGVLVAIFSIVMSILYIGFFMTLIATTTAMPV